MLQNLSPENKHKLKAAMGWMELDDFDEALSEISKLEPALLKLPEVLNLEWQLFAKQKDWSRALDVAREFVRLHPDTATAWIHQSYTLHELQRTLEARDHLLNAREKFPLNSLIVYNLACYSCQLKNNEEAFQWIQEAIALKEKSEILSMALEDSDLEPIRDRISTLA